MDVSLQYLGLDEETRTAVTSHIAERWAQFVRVAVLPDDFADENMVLDSLLVLKTPKQEARNLSCAISETIEVPPASSHNETENAITLTPSTEELFFQIDAKIGRLSHADLAKSRPAGNVIPDNRSGDFSRRELILSVRKGFQKYSDAPVVFPASCEAKYGCRACIEACPFRALNLGNKSTVVVSDADCKRCGICAAACRVSAIQMPGFSEASYGSLLDGISKSENRERKTTLVVTCNSAYLGENHPWMDVEQVQDVGVVGVRQLTKMLVSSSFDALIVYCPDGLCLGKNVARNAVESVLPLATQSGCGKTLAFFEGPAAVEEIKVLHLESGSSALVPISVKLTGRPWEEYVASLKAMEKLSEERFVDAGLIPLSGMQITDISISKTCTLCNACVSMCPHHSFGLSDGELVFDPRGCTNCGLCEKICPERSVNLVPMERMARLRPGTVFKDALVECAGCGKPLGSKGFLQRVQTLVGEEDRMMKFCSSCKQKQVLDSLMSMGLSRR